MRLAEQINDHELLLQGYMGQIADLLECGDIQTATQVIAAYSRRAEELRQPYYLWLSLTWKAMLAGMEGRFAEAEQFAHHALAIGQKAQDSDAVQYFTAQIVAFRGGRGLQETEASVKELVGQSNAIPAWHSALALIYADMGLQSEARYEFEYFAAQHFTTIPHDREWLGTLANLAQVCAFLRDERRSTLLYQLLLPYAERYVLFGPAVVHLGSVARFLGLLAMTMGQWEEAWKHFEEALRKNTEIGARPLTALTQLAYARMLGFRNQPGDLEWAADLLSQALTTARDLGMDDLLRRVAIMQSQIQRSHHDDEEQDASQKSKVKSQKQPESRNWGREVGQLGASSLGLETSFPSPQASSPKPLVPSVFRHEGDYWTIAYDGMILRLKDTAGLRYLAQLLRHPEQEFHVLDLVENGVGRGTEISASAKAAAVELESPRLSNAGEILDPQARTAYKQRRKELQTELAEAEEFHDLDRVERLREELELLAQELAKAVGLGGRDRKAAAERARVNVTRAIKATIKKSGEQRPALELYLATTIKTGLFCSYTPDPRIPVTWEF